MSPTIVLSFKYDDQAYIIVDFHDGEPPEVLPDLPYHWRTAVAADPPATRRRTFALIEGGLRPTPLGPAAA